MKNISEKKIYKRPRFPPLLLKIFIFISMLFLVLPSITFADNNINDKYTYDKYTYTVQTVLNILEGRFIQDNEKIEKKEKPDIFLEESKDVEQEKNNISSEKASQEILGKEYKIAPIPSFEGSIMERLQRESVLSLNKINQGIDDIGTSLYYAISQTLIGLAPIVLVVGTLFMMFSRGRGVGLIMLFGALLFIVLFAPEIVKLFISMIQGILK